MRIAVDGRHLADSRGIARYTRAMLAALARAHPDDEWRVVVPGAAPVDAPLALLRPPLDGRLIFGAAAVTGRPRLDRIAGGADVAWVPAPAPVGISRDVPFVLTVHDLSWLRRPADFTPYERLWHRAARIPALARRAARVIAVSEATRAEVLAAWDLPPEKVVVVRSGPGLEPPAGPAATHPDRPYLLAVGALEPRKAPELLARAHARARARGLRADLVFAGAGRLAGAVAGDGVRVLGAISDDQLGALYAGALALVQPALLEGFAFPPAEALVHGTPVIVADLPVHRETVGEGALRVPPGDEAALADALLRIEREPALRERLAAAGAAAVARLSWLSAARETHAVLREAAGR